MAQSMKNCLRISMAIRNLGTLKNYKMTKRFIQTTVRSTHNYNKETLVSPRPQLISEAPEQLSDVPSLEGAFRNCKTVFHIFNVVRTNERKMTVDDALCALNALTNIARNDPDTIAQNLHESNEFLALCEVLKKNISSLDPAACVIALKAMVLFNVPATSVIVQLLLQMLRNSVNDLSLAQISFLHFLLTKCQSTPLVDALKVALPLVYENNVLMKLNRQDPRSIQHALVYLSRKTKNTTVISVLLHALQHCKQPVDASTATSVLRSLCDLRCYVDEAPSMFHHIQNILAQEVSLLGRQVVMQLLVKIGIKMRYNETYCYHEGFVDACVSRAITEDWGFEDAIAILDSLISIGHTQISLLDYIAGKCYENPSLLESCSAENMAIIIHGYSAADYKPVFWDILQESFTPDRFLRETMRYPLSKLVMNLLSLDIYSEELLAETFRTSPSKTEYHPAEMWRTLVLYQAVTTLYPQYKGPLPVRAISDFLRSSTKVQDFPLAEALESALGGPNYVVTKLRSKVGHLIDHAVVMKKGGFPISISDQVGTRVQQSFIELESIKPPENSQVILIMSLPASAYSINTQRMKGIFSLQLRSLEALTKYTVLPIRTSMWFSLSEAEKIPYLMQAIRLKCAEISVSANL